MLQRFLSLFRRIVGGNPQTMVAGEVAGDDRRVWVRYPSVARISVQSRLDGQDGLLSARVRNVSRGGVNLVVNHRFTPGDMISIIVPGNTSEERSTVLACIVHVHPLSGGFYSLGCAFSEMLDEEDLEGFVAKKERPSGSEKRGWARHVANLKATYQVVSDPEQMTWTARVLNLSLGGIGLEVDQPVETGTLLNVNLEGDAGQPRTILACVVHVVSSSGSERALGCNFINELSEADFKALV